MPLLFSCPKCSALSPTKGGCDRHKAWHSPSMPSGWNERRAAKLQANPYCENPYSYHGERTKAVTVDHILARAFEGKEEWSNYRSLCRKCADQKDHEDREQGKKRKKAG